MVALYGGQKTILQAIRDLPKDSYGNITDSQIAATTAIAIDDVRNWILTLTDEGLVEVVKTERGFDVSITPKGTLTLELSLSVATTAPESTLKSVSTNISTNHSSQELASLLDARLPGVLRLVRIKQAERKITEEDGQEFIDQLKARHADIVKNILSGNSVAAHVMIGDFTECVTEFLVTTDSLKEQRWRDAHPFRLVKGFKYDSGRPDSNRRPRNYHIAEDLYPGGGVARQLKHFDEKYYDSWDDDPQTSGLEWAGKMKYDLIERIQLNCDFVKTLEIDPDSFDVQVAVRTTDGRKLPANSLIRFHLHPTFDPKIRNRTVENGEAVLRFLAKEAFIIGAEIRLPDESLPNDESKKRTVFLKLDLRYVPDAADMFTGNWLMNGRSGP